jgi:2',3'-cyclic-nucleotide 2'-phosphodiesterase (5'-nucleotidase family)
MVIVLMHSGISRDIPYPIRDKDTEMLPFLSGISAIIAGHSHLLTYDKINNVPVIQADAYAVGVNELHFQIRNHNGMRDISYIGMDTLRSTNAIPDKAIKTLIDNEAQKYGFYDKLTYSKDVLIHNAEINPYDYTAPGAYVSMSYAYAYKKLHPEIKIPVIGVNHYGGIRSSFSKGEVNYLHALNILPFGGKVIAYQFTGASLARLLTIGRTTAKNYLQTSNLTFHVDKSNTVDRIWYQDKEISPTDRCIVVLDNYIADGSDGYDASLFAHPLETIGITTKLFTAYLRTLPEISLKKAPLPIVKHD